MRAYSHLPTRAGKKKRKRGGGKKVRQQKEAFDEREAKRQAQRELEQRTGAEGVFASINAMIGDASQAAAIRRAEAEEAGGAGSGGGGMGGRNAHLFQPPGGAKAAAGSKAAKVGGCWRAAPVCTALVAGCARPPDHHPCGHRGLPDSASCLLSAPFGSQLQPQSCLSLITPSPPLQEPDRRALASQQDQLAALRQKVARLGDMAKRNAKDKVQWVWLAGGMGERGSIRRRDGGNREY